MLPFHVLRLAPVAVAAASVIWNSADKDVDVTLSVGDTVATVVSDGDDYGMVRSVTGHSTGSHQYELTAAVVGGSFYHEVGFAKSTAGLTFYPGYDADGWAYSSTGDKITNNTTTSLGSPFIEGSRVGCVWYAAEGAITFYMRGKWQGLGFTGLSGTLFAAWGPGTGGVGTRSATIIGQSLLHPVAGVADWAGNAGPSAVSSWNPSDKDADFTLYADNTVATIVSDGDDYGMVRSVTGHSTGVKQAEFIVKGSVHHLLGLATAAATGDYPGAHANSYGWYDGNGNKYNNSSASAYGTSWAAGDVIGVVWNATAGTITFYKNGISQGVAWSGVSGTLHLAYGAGSGGAGTRTCYVNTGSTAFVFPVPGADAWSGATFAPALALNWFCRDPNTTLSNSDRTLTGYGSANGGAARANIGKSTGKWYVEFVCDTLAGNYNVVGVCTDAFDIHTTGQYLGGTVTGWSYFSHGNRYTNGSSTAGHSTFTTGDVIGIAWDAAAQKLWFAKNNVWQGSGDPAAGTNESYASVTGAAIYPACEAYSTPGNVVSIRAAAGATYSPPTGFTYWG